MKLLGKNMQEMETIGGCRKENMMKLHFSFLSFAFFEF